MRMQRVEVKKVHEFDIQQRGVRKEVKNEVEAGWNRWRGYCDGRGKGKGLQDNSEVSPSLFGSDKDG